jgi:Holliday junction DNA helicase RuvB
MEDPNKGTEYLDKAAQRDEPQDAALRPLAFDDFTGQPLTIERLRIMTGASLKRGSVMGHVLLSGPPGLGKTTLAHIIGNTMGTQVHVTSGPVIERPGDLAGMLTNLGEGDILFIDEMHRVPKAVEEYLYSAMEDFRIDIVIDQGPNARSVRLDLPRFTLVGATTRLGLLTAPLRSRFTLNSRLNYYQRQDLVKIVTRSCDLLEVPLEKNGAQEIANRARGTPRIANNLIHFVRDYADERAQGIISAEVAGKALALLEIDERGLDELDKRLISIMARHYKGGPVGLGTLAVALGEEQHTLEEVHEPYLIQEGYLQRTPQGRVLTAQGWEISGFQSGDAGQLNLLS